MEQPFGLGLRDAGDRNPGPHRHDLRDLLLIHRWGVAGHGGLPGFAEAVDAVAHLRLRLAQLCRGLVLLGVDRGILLLGHPVQLPLGFPQWRRRRRVTQADPARGLVDEVDCLVGQVAIGDVPDRQIGGRAERSIGDGHLVMLLVPFTDPHEDLDRLLLRRLVDHDRLEATLEGSVALDVLAVLVECRRADALQLTAGQRRLEDVRRVDGTLRSSGTDEGMELVDEEHRIVGVAKLLDDLLETFLELAAVLGPGDERSDVEREDPLVQQDVRHVPRHDPVGEALGDRGLPDAGFADQGGIVLGLPAEDLDDALDLLLATDHGVKLSGTSGIGEVDPEGVDGRCLG